MPQKHRVSPLFCSAAVLAILAFQGLASAQDCVCPCPCSKAAVKSNLKIKYVPLKYVAPGDGKKMYAEYCAVCHGSLATGDGRANSALVVPASSLVNLKADNNGHFPDARVRKVLTENNIQAHQVDMPRWWTEFRRIDKKHPTHADQRINSLIVYLHQIQAPGLMQANSEPSATK